MQNGLFLAGYGERIWSVEGARGAWRIRPFTEGSQYTPEVYRTLLEAQHAALVAAGVRRA